MPCRRGFAMSFDSARVSLRSHARALLATPQPLMDWLRDQPLDESGGFCRQPTRCIIARFLSDGIGEKIAFDGLRYGLAGSSRRYSAKGWVKRLGEWFDLSAPDNAPGPTHRQVLERLEGVPPHQTKQQADG